MNKTVSYSDVEELRLLAEMYGDSEVEALASEALSDPDNEEMWREATIRCYNRGVRTSPPFVEDRKWTCTAVFPSCAGQEVDMEIHRQLASKGEWRYRCCDGVALQEALRLSERGVTEEVDDSEIVFSFKEDPRPTKSGWFWRENGGSKSGGPTRTLIDAQQGAYEALSLGVPEKDPEGHFFTHSGCEVRHPGVISTLCCPQWKEGTKGVEVSRPDGGVGWLAIRRDGSLLAPNTFAPGPEVVLPLPK